MKVLILVSALFAVAVAKPGVLQGIPGHGAIIAPLSYARVVPGAPIGPDGRVVDTLEVAVAKAAHTAAHINEKVTLVNEAVNSADFVGYSAPAVVSAYATPGVLPAYGAQQIYLGSVAGAPIGVDGRVVDTPEVAVAKAAHTAAHINEKVILLNEAAKNNALYAAPAVVSAYGTPLLSGVYPEVQGLAYGTIV